GIRDLIVTGVQTCALPIYPGSASRTWILGGIIALGLSSFVAMAELDSTSHEPTNGFGGSLAGRAWTTLQSKKQGNGKLHPTHSEIGRASCRERSQRTAD